MSILKVYTFYTHEYTFLYFGYIAFLLGYRELVLHSLKVYILVRNFVFFTD